MMISGGAIFSEPIQMMQSIFPVSPCHDLALYDPIEIYWMGYGSLVRAAVGSLLLCHFLVSVCFMVILEIDLDD